MKKSYAKITKIFAIAAIIVIIGLSGFLVWLRTGSLTDTKLWAFNFFNIPLASVQEQPLYAKDLSRRYKLAQLLDDKSNTDQALKQAIVDEMVQEQQTNLLAKKYNVLVSPQDLADELTYIKQSGFSAKQFPEVLQQTNLTEQEFTQKILYPEVQKNKLEIWYNSQPNLEAEAYNKVNTITAELAKGGSFENLASQYSDSSSKAFHGDLGFVNISSLLPEVQQALLQAKTGDTLTVPSRLGIHIIRLQSFKTDKQGAALKEIYIKTDGFEPWFKQEASNYKLSGLSHF